MMIIVLVINRTNNNMPFPQIEFEETDNLSGSDRGEGGFGSTGE